MPTRTPNGAIINFGAIQAGTPITKVNGYDVIANPKPKSLGISIAEAIIEDAELSLFGGIVAETKLGKRLLKIVAFIERKIGQGAKATYQGVKRGIKKGGTKLAGKNPSRQAIYKEHGYVEQTDEKSILEKIEQFAETNEEFKSVVNKIYNSAKKGGKETWNKNRHEYGDNELGGDGFHINKVDYDDTSNSYTYHYTQETKNEDYGSYFDKQRRIRQETLARAEGERIKHFVQPIYDPEQEARNTHIRGDNIKEAQLLNDFSQITGHNIYSSNGKTTFSPITNKSKDFTQTQLLNIWKVIKKGKTEITRINTQVKEKVNSPNNNLIYPKTEDFKPKADNTSLINTPITSNTAITHFSNIKQSNNYTDRRNYNQFNFHNQSPVINNDWKSVNDKYVDKIDGEKLQNYVENN
jgi:predicted transglutaminase-like cysteine proteinase